MDMGFLKDFELKFLVNINHGLCVTIYYYLVLDVNIWVFTKNTYYICTYICMWRIIILVRKSTSFCCQSKENLRLWNNQVKNAFVTLHVQKSHGCECFRIKHLSLSGQTEKFINSPWVHYFWLQKFQLFFKLQITSTHTSLPRNLRVPSSTVID